MRSSASNSKSTDSIPKRDKAKFVPRWMFLLAVSLLGVTMIAGGVVLASVVHHQVTAGHHRDMQTSLIGAQISTNRLHGCRLLDAIPVGRSPILDEFRNSPYPVGIRPDGKFIYQPYCPTP